ncbi:hypothetical protein L1987_62371 [Smallanthus sonchifolius]|uniref:Uncharacterized protein n=1 Tax=Smallanthus sonchifolius TaxID=185202 RepID=A0ACB9CAJ6_9ASTR|nr:hypothetical protein L1987_62371 [Smallanthus sonchifolius]
MDSNRLHIPKSGLPNGRSISNFVFPAIANLVLTMEDHFGFCPLIDFIGPLRNTTSEYCNREPRYMSIRMPKMITQHFGLSPGCGALKSCRDEWNEKEKQVWRWLPEACGGRWKKVWRWRWWLPDVCGGHWKVWRWLSDACGGFRKKYVGFLGEENHQSAVDYLTQEKVVVVIVLLTINLQY